MFDFLFGARLMGASDRRYLKSGANAKIRGFSDILSVKTLKIKHLADKLSKTATSCQYGNLHQAEQPVAAEQAIAEANIGEPVNANEIVRNFVKIL